MPKGETNSLVHRRSRIPFSCVRCHITGALGQQPKTCTAEGSAKSLIDPRNELRVGLSPVRAADGPILAYRMGVDLSISRFSLSARTAPVRAWPQRGPAQFGPIRYQNASQGRTAASSRSPLTGAG
jgi:hypothetical protein